MVYINFLYVWQLQRLVPLPLHLRYSTILVLQHLAVWPYILGLLMYNSFHEYGKLQEQHSPTSVDRNKESSLQRWTKIGVVITCYSCCSHLRNMRRNSAQYQTRECNHQQASNWKIIWVSMLRNIQARQWESMSWLILPATTCSCVVQHRVGLGGSNRRNQIGSLMFKPRLGHMHQPNLSIP